MLTKRFRETVRRVPFSLLTPDCSELQTIIYGGHHYIRLPPHCRIATDDQPDSHTILLGAITQSMST